MATRWLTLLLCGAFAGCGAFGTKTTLERRAPNRAASDAAPTGGAPNGGDDATDGSKGKDGPASVERNDGTEPAKNDPASSPKDNDQTGETDTSDDESSPVADQPNPPPTKPSVKTLGAMTRLFGAKLEGNAGYDYAPAVMKEGDIYRFYWCTPAKTPGFDPNGNGGYSDQVAFTWSRELTIAADQEYGTAAGVLTFPHAGNDGLHHVCDPSVIKVGATYVMYLTGTRDSIGYYGDIYALTSQNGATFTPMNGGLPIVKRHDLAMQTTYGAGEPSVFFKDGKYYMAYVDTTGTATARPARPGRIAGIYLIRSTDPAFQVSVERFSADGEWTAAGAGGSGAGSTTYSPFPLDQSVDWLYWKEKNLVMMARPGDGEFGGVTPSVELTFFDGSTWARRRDLDLTLTGSKWRDGVALLRDELGHAVALSDGKIMADIFSAYSFDCPTRGDCGNYPNMADPGAWDLSHTPLTIAP